VRPVVVGLFEQEPAGISIRSKRGYIMYPRSGNSRVSGVGYGKTAGGGFSIASVPVTLRGVL